MHKYNKKFSNEIENIYDKNVEVFKKRLIMYNIINHSELDINNISNLILNKIKNKDNINNILIIGNGKIKKNISNTIKDYDIIVRFNNYLKDNPLDLVETKTDIHFTCLPKKISEYKKWISNNANIIIPIELNNQSRYDYLKELSDKNIFIPDKKYRESLSKYNIDFTRGFFGLSIMLQLQQNYFKNAKISIIGYGGVGHHFNKNNIMLHGHEYEITIINELKNKKIITDLNDLF